MFLLLFFCLWWEVGLEKLWCDVCRDVAGRSSADGWFGLIGRVFAAAAVAAAAVGGCLVEERSVCHGRRAGECEGRVGMWASRIERWLKRLRRLSRFGCGCLDCLPLCEACEGENCACIVVRNSWTEASTYPT